MADLLHYLGGQVRQWFLNRRRPARRRVSLRCTVSISESSDEEEGRFSSALTGKTFDLSSGGLAVLLPAIRIGQRYIVGENRPLRIVLDLPAGSVTASIVGTRYDRVEESGETTYMIGARIAKIGQRDRELLTRYLNSL